MRRRWLVYERASRRCQKCGIYMTFEQMEMDHVIPRGQGGDDRLSNLQALCGPLQNKCHRGGKNSKHP